MKARDLKAHLDAQLGTDALAGRMKDERGAETRAQAWTRFYREIEALGEGEQVAKKLENEVYATFPAEQPTSTEVGE